jgi:hypothetical protein
MGMGNFNISVPSESIFSSYFSVTLRVVPSGFYDWYLILKQCEVLGIRWGSLECGSARLKVRAYKGVCGCVDVGPGTRADKNPSFQFSNFPIP